jgi:hypothetical protein
MTTSLAGAITLALISVSAGESPVSITRQAFPEDFSVQSFDYSSNVAFAAPMRVNDRDALSYSGQAPSTSRISVQGRKVGAGGCAFSVNRDVAAPQPPKAGLQYKEVAYDAASCKSTFEITPAVSDAAQQPGSQSVGDGRSAGPNSGTAQTASAPVCTNPYADTSQSYAHDACIHSWFQDPAGIHANDLTNEAQWNPAGTCANTGRSYASYYAQWVSAAGWRLGSNNFSPSFTCAAVTSHSATVFNNDTLCAGQPMVTSYDQHIDGRADGSYDWNVAWSKTGTCSFLLTFDTKNN